VDQTSRLALLETTIREIIHQLLELPVTPHVRELRARTVTYGRVIGQWSMHTPTDAQREAMYECVMELQAKVRLARDETSGVSPSRSPGRSRTPGPMAAPTDEDWANLLDDGTGVHRRGQSSVPARPPSFPASPFPSSHAPPTTPPTSRTRGAKLGSEAPTPVPALLRSRRGR
jgi:hypothetical protein